MMKMMMMMMGIWGPVVECTPADEGEDDENGEEEDDYDEDDLWEGVLLLPEKS